MRPNEVRTAADARQIVEKLERYFETI